MLSINETEQVRHLWPLSDRLGLRKCSFRTSSGKISQRSGSEISGLTRSVCLVAKTNRPESLSPPLLPPSTSSDGSESFSSRPSFGFSSSLSSTPSAETFASRHGVSLSSCSIPMLVRKETLPVLIYMYFYTSFGIIFAAYRGCLRHAGYWNPLHRSGRHCAASRPTHSKHRWQIVTSCPHL